MKRICVFALGLSLLNMIGCGSENAQKETSTKEAQSALDKSLSKEEQERLKASASSFNFKGAK